VFNVSVLRSDNVVSGLKNYVFHLPPATFSAIVGPRSMADIRISSIMLQMSFFDVQFVAEIKIKF